MKPIVQLLGFAARHGRVLLIAGLVLGVALPELSNLMRPWLPESVAALLFVSALRVGPRQALGVVTEQKMALFFVAVLQVLLPLCLVCFFLVFGIVGALPLVLILVISASPISGAPNLCVLVGHDPAHALRQLVIGTALLPLTVIPVFWLVPELGAISAVLASATRLLEIIAVSAGIAFFLRAKVFPSPSDEGLRAIDGLSAIAMATIVIGLMSSVGPAIWSDRTGLIFNLFVAFSANLVLQVGVSLLLRRSRWSEYSVPMGISAGNRNIALFLTALPHEITDPLLLFIGCYQVPMYLTPVVLGRFYSSRR